MKIIYYSSPPFADCDFPLIREYQRKGIEVYYFIKLPVYSLRSTLIDIKEQIKKPGIYKASVYKELELYKEYIDLDKVYVLNQPHKSVFHWSNILMNIKFLLISIKINSDVFHCTNPLDTFEVLLYWFRKRMVLTVHDPFPHTGEQDIRKKIFRRVAFGLVQKLVLLNNSQKKNFAKVYRIKETRILINKLGVYIFLDIYRNEKNIEKKSILFFGRIFPYKGIEYLLDAFEMILLQFPDYKLVIAGSGKLYFDFSPYINNKKITFINRYVGMEELTHLIEECKFIVCPYTDATQSGVIQTAFALNKPVIASNVGGLSETVEDGKTGLLVPPKNSEELSKAMIKLLSNSQLLETMSDTIKNMYLKRENSWEEVAEKYVNFYNLIIK